MKILFCTINRTNRVASHIFTSMPNELSKIADVEFITRSLSTTAGRYNTDCMKGIRKPIKLIDVDYANTFDLVITDAIFAFPTEDWNAISATKAVLIEDNHGPTTKWYIDKSKSHWNFDLYLLRYHSACIQTHPWLQDETTIWTPHSINPELHKDYNLPKTKECILVGAVTNNSYPLRYLADVKLRGKPYYERIYRPKETTDIKAKRWPIGKDYAKVLNESKMVITCTSVYSYPIIKFFEIPGCKSVLCSDYTDDLKKLGFIPGINMIQLNKNSIAPTIEKWLSSSSLADVEQAGYDLIHSYHTAKIRAQQLLKKLERLI